MLPVGLSEWKITDVHPIPTILFKNVLRTIEAEISKIFFKEHSSSTTAQKFDVLTKKYIIIAPATSREWLQSLRNVELTEFYFLERQLKVKHVSQVATVLAIARCVTLKKQHL